jgi:seryl-tRNA synthetase
MLDLRYVAQHFDDVVRRLNRRGTVDLGEFKRLFGERRELNVRVEAVRGEAADVGALLSPGKQPVTRTVRGKAYTQPLDDAGKGELRGLSKELKEKGKDLEGKLKEVEEQLSRILLTVPNLPHDSVPDGRSSEDNPVVRLGGEVERGRLAPGASLPRSTSRPRRTGSWASRWASSTSSAPPRSAGRASLSIAAWAPSWSAR